MQPFNIGWRTLDEDVYYYHAIQLGQINCIINNGKLSTKMECQINAALNNN